MALSLDDGLITGSEIGLGTKTTFSETPGSHDRAAVVQRVHKLRAFDCRIRTGY